MSGSAVASAAPLKKMAAAKATSRARMGPLAGADTCKNANGPGMFRAGRVPRPPRAHILGLGRMRSDDRFVDGRAPTGAGREEKLAVLDFVWLGEELRLPRNLVDVEFHDAEVGKRRTE